MSHGRLVVQAQRFRSRSPLAIVAAKSQGHVRQTICQCCDCISRRRWLPTANWQIIECMSDERLLVATETQRFVWHSPSDLAACSKSCLCVGFLDSFRNSLPSVSDWMCLRGGCGDCSVCPAPPLLFYLMKSAWMWASNECICTNLNLVFQLKNLISLRSCHWLELGDSTPPCHLFSCLIIFHLYFFNVHHFILKCPVYLQNFNEDG